MIKIKKVPEQFKKIKKSNYYGKTITGEVCPLCGEEFWHSKVINHIFVMAKSEVWKVYVNKKYLKQKIKTPHLDYFEKNFKIKAFNKTIFVLK